jgi:Integrase core domain
LDIWVRHDGAKPVRPWLTVIMDDYSRAIAGLRLSFQAPSAIQTALTLRQAMWRKPAAMWHICGIPETFYSDHGSDFTSEHSAQVCADLKMVLVFSEPGMPRGRGKIERFFRTVNQRLLCGLPGYTPGGAPPDGALPSSVTCADATAISDSAMGRPAWENPLGPVLCQLGYRHCVLVVSDIIREKVSPGRWKSDGFVYAGGGQLAEAH